VRQRKRIETLARWKWFLAGRPARRDLDFWLEAEKDLAARAAGRVGSAAPLASVTPRFVLLMRHGEPARIGAEEMTGLSQQGEKEVAEVASTLAHALNEMPVGGGPRIDVGTIWHANSPEATATAGLLDAALGSVGPAAGPESKSLLDPTVFGAYGNTDAHKRLVKKIAEQFKEWSEGSSHNAIVIVGHQPLLDWIALEVGREGIPIARAELVSIEVRRPKLDQADPELREGELRWVVTPDDGGKALSELRDKIKSKMDVAKVLGGLLPTALSFLLASLIDPSKLKREPPDPLLWAYLYVALTCLFTASLLYLLTVYAYDQLLMPKRFWSESPGAPDKRPRWLVWRPPSSATWILYQNMIRVWNSLFVPATGAVLLGLAALSLAVVHPDHRWYALGVALLLGAVFTSYWRRFSPRLGTED
jgi:phosphohistidine phosphatase SixA